MAQSSSRAMGFSATSNHRRMSMRRRFFYMALRHPMGLWSSIRMGLQRRLGVRLNRRLYPGKSIPPVLLGMDVTRRCNLKCVMCQQNRHVAHEDAGLPWYDKDHEMPLSSWVNVLDQVRPFRPWLTVTGGEPLLYPDIKGLIEATKERDLVLDITTNGTLLKGMADFLVDVGVEMVFVSLDGPEDVHDRIRGVVGSYGRTIEGIQALVEERDSRGSLGPVVVINCTMTRDNLHTLPEMVPLALRHNVNLLQFIHAHFNTWENAELHNRILSPEFAELHGLDLVPPSLPHSEYYENEIRPEDLPLMQSRLEEAIKKADGEIPVKILPGLRLHQVDPYYFDIDYPFSRNCRALWAKCRILPDGTVSPCLHVVAGNVKDTPLLEIWNGPKMQALRQIIAKRLFPACVRCCNREF